MQMHGAGVRKLAGTLLSTFEGIHESGDGGESADGGTPPTPTHDLPSPTISCSTTVRQLCSIESNIRNFL